VELARRRGSDAPQPLDRQRVEELELALRRDDEQDRRAWPSGSRSWPDLRPRDAHAQRQPELLADLPAQGDRDLHSRAGGTAHVEERLLHRAGSTTGAQRSKISNTARLAST
jgi:hypothetical protein